MKTFLRAGLAAGALVLALVAALRFQAQRSGQEELIRRLEPHLSPQRLSLTAQRLRREPDPAQAKVQAARALLSQALEELTVQAPGQRQDLLAALELARSLATGAAAERPASWGAALTQGASTYLLRSLARDDRLFTEAPAWEAPMWRAVELAPSEKEPARFLSMAYLELWPLLPEWKRRDARELLAVALEDPPTFDRLIRPWLATAEDLETALELMPADPEAWAKLRTLFAQRRDWTAYRRVHTGWRRHLATYADARLQEARDLLAAGNAGGARAVLLVTLGELPVDGTFAPTFEEAVRLLPPGPLAPAVRQRFRRWLDWALEPYQLGSPPSLPPRVMDRLAGWADDLPPVQAALAALAGGDLPRAERYERRHAAVGQAAWAPYQLAKTRFLLDRGDWAGAGAALDAIPPAGRTSAAYWQRRLALARARGDTPDESDANHTLAALSRTRWPAAAWRWHGERARLTLSAARAADGLRIEVPEAGAVGAVVEVRWNGTTVDALPVMPATGALAVEVPVTTGLHRLELETVAGDRLLPGAVTLADTAAPTAP